MICFPNCKINLGLYITGRRPDGFHNLETVFYPVQWCDALEVIEHPQGREFELETSGMAIDVPAEKNILYKAWSLLRSEKEIPPVLVHLFKKIPAGAGLGGGSADAAFFLRLLNDKFSLGFSSEELRDISLELGSDCPFFIENKPVVARGRGEIMTPIGVNLDKYFLMLVFPGIHSNTAEAFKSITPAPAPLHIEDILAKPVEEWKGRLKNDFEPALFKKHPVLGKIKEDLYKAGALYASMSGSGSTLFGVFEKAPDRSIASGFTVHVQGPGGEIL